MRPNRWYLISGNVWKMVFLCIPSGSIFGFHVDFRGCTLYQSSFFGMKINVEMCRKGWCIQRQMIVAY